MTKQSLMEFPCDFSVKIIGTNSNVFLEDIKKIVLKHFPDFNHNHLIYKLSKNNNYLAITATVVAENQQMLDSFYMELNQHPDIKMVL